jgi:hypothetical protein
MCCLGHNVVSLWGWTYKWVKYTEGPGILSESSEGIQRIKTGVDSMKKATRWESPIWMRPVIAETLRDYKWAVYAKTMNIEKDHEYKGC